MEQHEGIIFMYCGSMRWMEVEVAGAPASMALRAPAKNTKPAAPRAECHNDVHRMYIRPAGEKAAMGAVAQRKARSARTASIPACHPNARLECGCMTLA